MLGCPGENEEAFFHLPGMLLTYLPISSVRQVVAGYGESRRGIFPTGLAKLWCSGENEEAFSSSLTHVTLLARFLALGGCSCCLLVLVLRVRLCYTWMEGVQCF